MRKSLIGGGQLEAAAANESLAVPRAARRLLGWKLPDGTKRLRRVDVLVGRMTADWQQRSGGVRGGWLGAQSEGGRR